ncbi:MAG: hypothetical protein JW943_02610 [Deltaproteobacteria bacterium]|nr:hypothetical protein [Deltaproteobacteria bacterium]
MKKHILFLFIFGLFIIFPVVSHASYDIQFKGGGELQVPHYWEDNGEIQFYVTGGVMGVDKKMVRRINRIPVASDDDSQTDTAAKATEDDAAEGKGAKETTAAAGNDQNGPPEKTDSLSPASDKKPLAGPTAPPPKAPKDEEVMETLNGLEQKFESIESMSLAELHEFDRELTQLRKSIFANRTEYTHNDELMRMAEMGAKLEEMVAKEETGGQ